jgi:hypothetical protein
MIEWFRRFGEIVGLESYESPIPIPTDLPGRSAVPTIHEFDFGGKKRESLWWPEGVGGGTASPVHQKGSAIPMDAPAEDLLRNVYEGLELPGVARDYHFLIQSCANELWKRRRDFPELIAHVESLCWLDVRLIEAKPEAIRDENSQPPVYYRVLSFPTLVEVYEREGALHEALQVAQLASKYGETSDLNELKERIAAVEQEDRG